MRINSAPYADRSHTWTSPVPRGRRLRSLQNELDSDTVVGFITIAVAAVIYWIWKKRRPDAQSNVSRQQAFTMPTPAPTAPSAQTPVRERTREPGEAGSVFISYRRGDAGDVVGRIYDRLVNEFGKPRVFKDVDSIPLGVDFRKHLSDSVGKCRVFLAIISRGWVQQGDGVRRLDQPNDFVRIEMEAALHRNIPVIPLYWCRVRRCPRRRIFRPHCASSPTATQRPMGRPRFPPDITRLSMALHFTSTHSRRTLPTRHVRTDATRCREAGERRPVPRGLPGDRAWRISSRARPYP